MTDNAELIHNNIFVNYEWDSKEPSPVPNPIHPINTVDNSTILSGRKDDTEKLRLELVPVEAINAIARAMTYGAKKYTAWNWSRGIAHMRLVGACLRHVTAYVAGENIDRESGNHHLDHALASLSMLRASIENNLGEDDRPKYFRNKTTDQKELSK